LSFLGRAHMVLWCLIQCEGPGVNCFWLVLELGIGECVKCGPSRFPDHMLNVQPATFA